MRRTDASALYKSMNAFKADYDQAILSVIQRAQGVMAVAQGADGIIPAERIDSVKFQVGDMVQRFYVANDLRSAYGNDGVTPISTYAQLLNQYFVEVAYPVALWHEQRIKKLLPPDYLARAAFDKKFTRKEALELPHRVVGRDGLKLSDRIWNTSLLTRRQVDQFVSVNANMPVGELAKQFEQFLRPNGQAVPAAVYGTDASYNAMRLARNELSMFHSRMNVEASAQNPFVNGMEYKLSPRHPKRDICDDIATLGMGGARLREPYPINQCPIPVLDTHVNCICVIFASTFKNPRAIVAQLLQRQDFPPLLLDARQFLTDTMGQAFSTIIRFVGR